MGHCTRGMFLSAIKTKSPTLKLGFGHNYFCRSWSVGKHSFVYLHQNSFARRWTYFILLWTCLTLQTQLDKRMGVYVFGVSAFKSCWSLDTKVIGLSFKIFSISTKSIHKASSLSSRSPINEYKILLINHISLSYTLPWCLANGGSNLHSIPFLVKVDPLLIPHF